MILCRHYVVEIYITWIVLPSHGIIWCHASKRIYIFTHTAQTYWGRTHSEGYIGKRLSYMHTNLIKLNTFHPPFDVYNLENLLYSFCVKLWIFDINNFPYFSYVVNDFSYYLHMYTHTFINNNNNNNNKTKIEEVAKKRHCKFLENFWLGCARSIHSNTLRNFKSSLKW